MIPGLLESKERTPQRLWKGRHNNCVMQPDDIEGVSRKDKQKSLISQTQGQYQEGRQAGGSREKLNKGKAR